MEKAVTSPPVNLATFTTSSSDEDTKEFVMRFLHYNGFNWHIYNELREMRNYCLTFIKDLWHADTNAFGTITAGSSEACVIAAYTMLFNWKQWYTQKATNQTIRPNLIISAAAQECWPKFETLSGVELRIIPLTTDLRLDIKQAEEHCDDGTIGVVAILGSTLSGFYDDVKALNECLESHNAATNRRIKIHVDGAIGALFLPFVQIDVIFDFRLSQVASINASAHKYGLTPPAAAWLMFRNNSDVPNELKQEIDYLGGGFLTDLGINSSTTSIPLAAQYHLFKKLGRDGYAQKHTETLKVANFLVKELEQLPDISIITKEIHIPIICYEKRSDNPGWTLYDLEKHLGRQYGWHVATYEIPATGKTVHRIVIRADFTTKRALEFLAALKESLKLLAKGEQKC